MTTDVLSIAHDDPQVERFFRLGEALLDADPTRAWVDRAELRRQVAAPYLGQTRCFVASRDGRDLARCAAIVNPELRSAAGASIGAPVGAIGHFESEDDSAAARAVLDAACAWLGERGLTTVWGPFNQSIWHGYRLMTRGFDRDPFLGEPRNPAYYPALFERAGFAPLARWSSWDLAAPHLAGLRQAAKAMRSEELTRQGYRYHPFRVEAFDEELERVHALLSEGFRENLGFTDLPLSEFRALFSGMRHVIVGPLTPIVTDAAGAPVGMGYLYPDLAPALAEARASGRPLDEVLRERPARRLVFHTMVGVKAARGLGLVEWALAEVMEHVAAHGFTSGVGALAKEGPTIYHKTGKPTREYVLYARGA